MAKFLLAIPIAIALIALFFFVRMIVQVLRQSKEFDDQIEEALTESQNREKLRQRVADSANRRPGLPARSILNDFELPDLWGGNVTFSQWRGTRIAVLFVQPTCPFSRQLIADLRDLGARISGDDRQLIFITTGTPEENRDLFHGYSSRTPILLQRANEVARLWRVPITPAGYLFDAAGVTEGQIIHGVHEILPALTGLSADSGDAEVVDWRMETTKFLFPFASALPVFAVGDPAPMTALEPYLDAELRARMIGMKTLLLLSDSTCLPCIELLPEIESGYRNRRTDLNIVMVSRGAPEDAEQLRSTYGLTFPIIVHPNGELNRAFGVVDTPSAVLIDQDGLLLSKPAVGRDAILTLIDQTQAVPTV